MKSVEECYRGANVRVFRLDREAVIRRLLECAARLLRGRDDAIEVRLFGSLARGEAIPGSDADLFVLLREPAGPFLERLPTLARYFTGAGIGCDVVALTESELACLRAERRRFGREVDAGLVLARREPAAD